ncbi:MAG: dienelactone hydrolase family protein [Acidimicrobiia bacterium]|jgi:predicted alpha/beta-hydrolase family hydrolase
MSSSHTIAWDDQEVTGIIEGSGRLGILLAHGAGTDQKHPQIAMLRSGLAAGGHMVMSFNYPYTERGGKRPDRQEKLLACHRAAADYLAADVDSLVLAGRSMGGRMGTYLVADGYPADALVLYAYPLHPAGKPERLRIDQFTDISIPMLFFQGTRDALARMDLFEEHIAPLPHAGVEILEGAGHGPRGGGWTLETMTARYVSGTLAFLDRVSSGRSE